MGKYWKCFVSGFALLLACCMLPFTLVPQLAGAEGEQETGIETSEQQVYHAAMEINGNEVLKFDEAVMEQAEAKIEENADEASLQAVDGDSGQNAKDSSASLSESGKSGGTSLISPGTVVIVVIIVLAVLTFVVVIVRNIKSKGSY